MVGLFHVQIFCISSVLCCSFAGRTVANLAQYAAALYQLAFPQDDIIFPRVILALSSLVVICSSLDLMIEVNFPRRHGRIEQD